MIESKITVEGHEISLYHSMPPIPFRGMDWQANLTKDDGSDPEDNVPVGHGATADEAVQDLLQQLDGE